MAKRYNIRQIRKNQTYSVAELAEETGVTEQTVRRWIKAGMVTIGDKRPTYILGEAATEFLKALQGKAKRPMAQTELFCMTCSKPRAPLGMLADYTPHTPLSGRLSALCCACEREIYRNVSAAQLPELSRCLEIEIRGIQRDINEPNPHRLNDTFGKDTQTCGISTAKRAFEARLHHLYERDQRARSQVIG